MNYRRLLGLTALALSTLTFLPTSFASTNIQSITQNTGLSSHIVKLALNGYQHAKAEGKVDNTHYLTIVNFAQPSNQKRLYVIDLKTNKLIMKLHTAQGKGSGLKYATHFSNKPGTDTSSLGVYTTGVIYDGKHGESMRVRGLEAGINNNAYARSIVIHPATYVTPSFIHKYGRAGRSWGCFALNPKDSKQYINYAKGGSVIFAYAAPENHDPYVTEFA